MKGTWAILNTVIKKGHQAPSYPQEFVDNESAVENSMDIANGFAAHVNGNHTQFKKLLKTSLFST